MAKLAALISDLERTRQSRIFCMIHAGREHICLNEFEKFVSMREDFDGCETLELVLHSPGGHADMAYKLVKFFRRRCKNFNVIVPLVAKSAATLLCLGADTLFMGECAELGPLDVQIQDPIARGAEPISPLDEFKSMEFLRDYALEVSDFFTLLIIRQSGMSVKDAIEQSGAYITTMIRPLFEKIDPLEVGGHRRALAIGEEYAKRLLKLANNPEGLSIVEKLVWKYPSHEFGIDIDEAMELKLPVKVFDRQQEQPLSAAIMELTNEGISFSGFIKDSDSKRERKLPGNKAKAGKLPLNSNGVGPQRRARNQHPPVPGKAAFHDTQ